MPAAGHALIALQMLLVSAGYRLHTVGHAVNGRLTCAQEPPAVKLNDELGGILTFKLAGEDVVRGSGVPYSVIRPCALTEEPAGAELVLDQGDTIKGKISRCAC